MIKIVSAKYESNSFDRSEVLKKIGREKALTIYTNMVRARCFDKKLDQLIQKGHHIVQHSAEGQEATPVVACAVASNEDYLMPYHRGWAWAFGKGKNADKLIAELLGRKNGYCKGKAGPQLGADVNLRIMGRPGIQGAHLSIAVGIGLAIQLRKSNEVVLCFCGEGATRTCNFHEGLNMAGAWKLPILYFVENNGYQIFTKSHETIAVPDIALSGPGYNMPGIIVDGNDVLALYEVISSLLPKVRSGEGPVLIEAKTYRLQGHTSLDTFHYGGYRSKNEVDKWKKKCPISRFEDDVTIGGLLQKKEIDSIWEDAKKEMDKAANFALKSPFPADNEYLEDVYA